MNIKESIENYLEDIVNDIFKVSLEDFGNKKQAEKINKELCSKIEEFCRNEKINNDICEAVKYTLNKAFNNNRYETIVKLLRSTKEHKAFVDYLVKNVNCYETSDFVDNEDYKIYIRIIEMLSEAMFQEENLIRYIKLLSQNEVYVQMFKSQNDIYNLLLQIRNSINSEKAYINVGNSNQLEYKISDDNGYFRKLYNEELFLEIKEYTHDDYIAKLKRVYVEPKIESNKQSLKDKLENWNQQSDLDSDIHTDADAKVFLLYGKAGVGKSSLTANIIATEFLGKNCHAIALRKHIDKLSHVKAWQSVKDCFKCNDEAAYNDSVLILDGLDEICVLKKEFNGKEFVENLKNSAPSEVKILITSRYHSGYFEEIKSDNKLIISTIAWTEDEISEWCNKYCNVHKNNTRKQEWCENFIQSYEKLEPNDNRKDIFCTPIILYICCAKEIDISKHDSIAGIYDAAFYHIGHREHSKENSEDLKIPDDKQFKINWQYTKELAFQMFLNDILESGLDDELVNEAKIRTKELLQETDFEIDNNIQKYFAVFHFASCKTDGIEFAHKTVGEYFTAVKLYEDYFEKIEIKSDDDSAITSTWKNIYQAFRYKKIPEDIMQYLTDIIKSRKGNEFKEWRESFFEYYYRGMESQFLWEVMNDKSYYKSNELLMLPEQVSIAFRNLTWLLSFFEFKNDGEFNKEEYKRTFESFFIRTVNMDVNCSYWCNLYAAVGVNLKGIDLSRANFNYTDLQEANLAYVNLVGADLRGADLTGVDLKGAYLIGADLRGAYLVKEDLIEADLGGT